MPVDGDLPGVRGVADLRLRVEDAGDLLHRRARGLHLPVEVGQLLERLEDHVEHEHGGGDGAYLDRAVQEQVVADEQHGHHRDDAERLDAGEEERVQVLRMRVRLAVRRIRLVELGEECALAVEGLDDGHARDRLGDLRGHDRDRLAHAQERGVGLHLEPATEHERRRQDHERDEPEPPVEHEEADDRRQDRERVDDESRQSL